MAFSLSNLLKSKKETISETPIQKLEFKGGTKYAENETGDVYLDFEELGGFPYIKTIIIDTTSLKIKRVGCTLTFHFKDGSLTINSDNTDIDSNRIKNTPFYITPIDFEVTAEEAAIIKKNTIKNIAFTFKNNTYNYKTI